MFKRLFSKQPATPRIYATPEGETAYVVGDVHGCFDKLKDLMAKIENHAKDHAPSGYKLIFLGDLIDRGPRSKDVVEYLRTYQKDAVETIFLMGNHEDVLLGVIEGNARKLVSWFEFGGRDCLRSYGVDNLGEINISPENLLYRVQAMVPQNHVDFIETFQDYYVFGDYLCVHAGIRPGKPLAQQSVKDMRWIRDNFISYTKPHEYKIVHGHTITEEAEDLGNRIAIDTGGYNGGPLTAVYLCGTNQQFITSTATA